MIQKNIMVNIWNIFRKENFSKPFIAYSKEYATKGLFLRFLVRSNELTAQWELYCKFQKNQSVIKKELSKITFFGM